MASATPLPRMNWGKIAAQSIVAGALGGFLIDAWLWLMVVRPQGGSILNLWAYVASVAAGKGILTNPNAPWFGLALHAITSLVWAGAYAYVATRQPSVRRQWILAGFIYGIVVYMLMQTVLLISGNFVFPPTPNDFVIAFAAHTIFFGIPVALVVNLMDRA